MNTERLIDLLEELRSYVENEQFETISPKTWREFCERRESKLAEIETVIAQLGETV